MSEIFDIKGNMIRYKLRFCSCSFNRYLLKKCPCRFTKQGEAAGVKSK